MARAPKSQIYTVAGTKVSCPWPLAAPQARGQPQVRVEFVDQLPWALPSSAQDDWFQYAVPGEGDRRQFLRWRGIADFLVSQDGHLVQCRWNAQATEELFGAYLLNQVLSCALCCQGEETLHGTAVSGPKGAYVFLGASGRGKSTLLAALMGRGHKLVTDDLVKLDIQKKKIYPGLQRLKMCPDSLAAIWGQPANFTALNPYVEKFLVPVPSGQSAVSPTRVERIYILGEPLPHQGPAIQTRKLSGAEGLLTLAAQTFNTFTLRPRGPKAHFAHVSAVADQFEIHELRLTQDLSAIHHVAGALEDTW